MVHFVLFIFCLFMLFAQIHHQYHDC